MTNIKTTNINRRNLVLGATGMAATLPVFGFSSSASAKTIHRMSTLGPGTTPNLVMTTFANIINEKLPDHEIQINATGAATRHVLEVAKGKSAFCMSSPTVNFLLAKQKAMYKKIKDAPELAKEIRTVFNFPMGKYHIVVNEDSGIKSLKDIKGKRIFLGPPGGAALRTMKLLFEAVTGYKAGKDFDIVKLGWDAAAQGFQDKTFDVYCNPTNAPSPVISQIAASRKIRMLGIPEDQLSLPAIVKLTKRPGFRLVDLAPDAYGDAQANDKPVKTLGVTVSVIANKDVPEGTVYEMSKAFWKELPNIQKEAPWMRAIKPQSATKDLNLPLHPGAVKALTELGVKIP